MSDHAPQASGPAPFDAALPVEHACHDFETAWKAGGQPKIEDALAGAPGFLRAVMLRALLGIDLLYRRRNGERPVPEEYHARFPGDENLVQDVFRGTPTAAVTERQTAPRSTESAGEAAAAWPAIPGYEILNQLTPGGMGVVYRARQVGLDRTVALKMIRTGIHAGPQERARFRVEAEAVASLSHPHVVQIYECGEWQEMPYLAMEFADGGSLAERLLSGPPPFAEAAELLETLARAVQFVHERGIIHRDLKPANVLLQISDCRLQIENPQQRIPQSAISNLQSAIPKIADFGLAKRLDQDQGLTRTHAVLGTASYMAPEQAAGDKHAIGAAADIYALGAILYEVLTGRPPFEAETRELTIHQVLSEEPLPPGQLRADLPAELQAICLKCLEKEPARRFPSALALAEDLQRYQKGEPISVRTFGDFEWQARAARRAGYEILDILGTGFPGPVFKARQLALNRIVVLEMRASRTRLDPARLERLRADAEAVAQLHHPNIVEVYDLGELNGEPFIAREHVEGANLAQKVAGQLESAEQTAILVETLARAVHHAHVQHIMHGNLKPSRVLLGDDGTCKITGFGFTEVLRAALHEGDSKPRATDSMGMPLSAYTAPEQAENPAEDVSPSADVYALGAVLYELLAGRPPVRADSVDGMREQILLGKPEPPRLVRPEAPRELEAICLKCLDRQPAARYPTTAALAEDLRRFGAGEVLFIDDLDDWAQQQRWARRAGYEILELLGQGPDGFTYKARQVALERTVVLERVTARLRFVPVAKSRFRWEARLLSRLRHANVVQLYDQGEQSDLVYFAREFVDGPTLGESAAGAGPLAPGHAQSTDDEQDRILEAAELVEMLARALHAAHAEGIIHGGLNPGKVRITPGGMPKITSFRRVRLPGADAADLHPESDVRRLAGYLAPEQLEGRRRTVGPASDVYALGAILYRLLTGEPPFLGQTLEATIAQACTEAPASPCVRQPSIPPELESICLKCLAKPPSARFATAEALADALRQVAG